MQRREAAAARRRLGLTHPPVPVPHSVITVITSVMGINDGVNARPITVGRGSRVMMVMCLSDASGTRLADSETVTVTVRLGPARRGLGPRDSGSESESTDWQAAVLARHVTLRRWRSLDNIMMPITGTRRAGRRRHHHHRRLRRHQVAVTARQKVKS
jgi:hypothetical protein